MPLNGRSNSESVGLTPKVSEEMLDHCARSNSTSADDSLNSNGKASSATNHNFSGTNAHVEPVTTEMKTEQ